MGVKNSRYKVIALFLVLTLIIPLLSIGSYAQDDDALIIENDSLKITDELSKLDRPIKYPEIIEDSKIIEYDPATFVLDPPNENGEEYIETVEMYYGDMELYNKTLENTYPEPDLSIYDIPEEIPYEIANNIRPPLELQAELDPQALAIENGELSVQAAVAATPSITVSSVSQTSISVKVVYPTSTAWGNMLNCYDWTNAVRTYITPPSSWTTTAYYNVTDGTYTKSGLEPGRKYTFTIGYYQNSTWYYIEIHVFTTFKTPQITVSNIGPTTATLTTVFPCPTSANNYIYLYDTETWYGYEWLTDIPRVPIQGPNARDLTNYSLQNLVPNTTYKVKLRYYRDDLGQWQETIKTFTTAASSGTNTVNSGGKLSFTVPSYLSSKITSTLTNNLNTAFDDMVNLVGGQPAKGIPFNVTTSRTLGMSSGGMIVAQTDGKNIQYTEGFFNEHLLYLSYNSNTILRVLLHEMGHNFDSSRWSFDGEFFADLIAAYNLETRNHRFTQGTITYTGSDIKNYYKTHEPWGYDHSILKNTYHHYGLIYTLLNIKDTKMNKSWEPFKKTFQFFNNLDSNSIPLSDLGKLNLFLSKLSDFSGVNIFTYLTNQEKMVYGNRFGGTLGYINSGSMATAQEITIFNDKDRYSTITNVTIPIVGEIKWYKIKPMFDGTHKILLNGDNLVRAIIYNDLGLQVGLISSNGWSDVSMKPVLEKGKTYYIKVHNTFDNNAYRFNLYIYNPSKAIILLPGMMGSTIYGKALHPTALIPYTADNVKIWDPDKNALAITRFIDHNGAELAFKESGVPIRDDFNFGSNNEFGALDNFRTIYNRLASEFSKEYDVKLFSYDWRKSNSDSAVALETFINYSNYDDIVIVAHSMGGLVASKYIKNSTTNKNKVKNLITIATPYNGSVKGLYTLETGKIFAYGMAFTIENAQDFLLEGTFKKLAINMPGCYELLPTSYYSDPNKFVRVNNQYQTYSQAQTFIKGQSWAKNSSNVIKPMFDQATNFHNSLYSGSTHIANSVNSYYIYGTGVETIETVTYTGNNIGVISHLTFTDGDGTVRDTSAINRRSSSATNVWKIAHSLTESADHTKLMQNSKMLNCVVNIIKQKTYGTPTYFSANGESVNSINVNNKMTSIVIQGADELLITDIGGENIIVQGDSLYKTDSFGNILEKVGGAYILNHELNRWQYLFYSEFYGDIKVDGFSDEIASEVMIIEFDNYFYSSMETYNNIDELGSININISYSENYIQSVETNTIITPDIVANDFDLNNLNSNIN